MTDKPVKETLAGILAGEYCPHWFYEENMDEIVAELRRLYDENEAKDALLRQAVDRLDTARYNEADPVVRKHYEETITAIKERLQ